MAFAIKNTCKIATLNSFQREIESTAVVCTILNDVEYLHWRNKNNKEREKRSLPSRAMPAWKFDLLPLSWEVNRDTTREGERTHNSVGGGLADAQPEAGGTETPAPSCSLVLCLPSQLIFFFSTIPHTR